MVELQDKRRFFIDGVWVDPAQPKDLDVVDPSTEEIVAVISLGSATDTDRAVAAAKRAFSAWSQTKPLERLAYVERILAAYNRRSVEMAKAISTEMGAPLDMSLTEQVGVGAYHIENFIAAARDFRFVHPLDEHDCSSVVAWEPIGVVGLITPWNWPMNQVTLKVIPALLGGNTIVLKPSEIAPLSSMLFAEIIHQAGLPRGVFNLVNGDGAGVGAQLSVHPDVDMISFTGSTRAGIAITKAASETLKKVALELGGKGANLIFADADSDAVARGVRECFLNTGQSCNAPTRMLVERAIYDQSVATAASIAKEIRIASAHLPGDHIGPVVNKTQWEKIQDMIQIGMDEGAKLIAGGVGLPEGVNRGFFVRPTIFADVDNSMAIARQEIFGPVLCIIPFEDEDEAIAIANDTIYGLTNFVQSLDGARCNRLARRLRSGMVEINGQPLGPGSAFGGVKASGRAREGGKMGLEEFMDSKQVSCWSD